MLRKFLGALTALLLFAGSAFAQQPTQRATFRYAGANVTTFAATPSDWLVVVGSNTKSEVIVRRLSLCGTATNPATIDVLLIKRSSADTAGTQSGVTGGVTDSAAPITTPTGTVLLYTANPTLGTPVGAVFDAKKLNLSTVGAAGCVFWQFDLPDTRPPVLRGTIQQLAINLNGVTLPVGTSLTYTVETTEGP